MRRQSEADSVGDYSSRSLTSERAVWAVVGAHEGRRQDGWLDGTGASGLHCSVLHSGKIHLTQMDPSLLELLSEADT